MKKTCVIHVQGALLQLNNWNSTKTFIEKPNAHIVTKVCLNMRHIQSVTFLKFLFLVLLKYSLHLPNIVLAPLLLPVKVCSPLDPWRCTVVSGTKILAAEFWSPVLRSGASMDQTCLFSTSHRCLFGLRSGEFGGQVNTSLCSSNHSWTIFALWQGTLSCWKRPIPFPWKGVT